MTLAVESKDTLENLQELVTDIFRHVPSRPCQAPDLKKFAEPFGPSAFKKLYKIAPMKETVSLNFTWSLPSMQPFYKYVSFVCGLLMCAGLKY